MVMRAFFTLFFSCLILNSGYLQAKEKVTIYADQWCPYMCDIKSNMPGFVLEVAKEVLKNKYDLVFTEAAPWGRSIDVVKNDASISAVAGVMKAEAPGFIFPDEESGLAEVGIFTLNKKPWSFKDVASLQTLSLGVVKDYSYGKTLDQYINKHLKDKTKIQAAYGKQPLKEIINKLQNEKIDAFLADENIVLYTLKEMGADNVKLQKKNIDPPGKVYLAFSPKVKGSKEVAAELSAGIKKMRKDGSLLKILQKYQMSDWK